MSFIYKLKNALLDVLFPPACLSCLADLSESERENKICKKCLDSIFINSSFFCPKCRARLPDNEKTCHKEIKFLLAAATSYQNQAANNIIKFLKYSRWKGLIRTIGPIITNYLDNLNYDFSDFLVIPIPLHPDRLKERGFNQSELIAEFFCQRNNINIKTNLKRVRATKIQAELKNSEERRENVKKCFELINPEEIKNKNIVLIDDVFTTGSTMSEAVETLKNAGAKKIIAFVLAKT